MLCLTSAAYRLVVTGLLFTFLTVIASAQFRAGIQGSITDSTGAAISGAIVTITNLETTTTQKVTSSADGFYRITGLAPGRYAVSAERDGGAQVEVVSKNGTNDLHGSGFFKYNDPGLNAFNKYGGPTGDPNVNAPPVRVEQRFRQFGGSLGGPIYLPRFGEGGNPTWSGRDHLFFFFSYEGLRNKTDAPYTAYVETPEYRDLIERVRAGSVTAAVLRSQGIEPRINQVLPSTCATFGNDPTRCRVVPGGLDIGSPQFTTGRYVSLSNPTGGGFDGIPDLLFAQFANPNTTSGNQYNARVDYTRNKNTFAISTYFTKRNDVSSDGDAQSRPGADLINRPLNSAATFTYNRVITPAILNEIRFNFTRFASDQVAASSGTDFGIPRVEVEGLPINGRIRFGANRAETTPAVFAQNTFEFRDVLSWVRGNQGWKFGFERRWEQDNNNLLGGARPDYSFSGLFNLANDTPIFEAINADPRNGLPTDGQRYFRTGIWAGFVQNDWKIRPNLTLNLGLRYEYYPPLTEKQNRISNLQFGSQGLQNSRLVTTDRLFDPDRNNFAPRIGFAYSPKEFNNKLVIRGGWGVAYNRTPGVLFLNSRGNPPFFARYNLCCGTAQGDFGSPFANGQILYVLGANSSPLSYPVNPALAQGIDPVSGGVLNSTVEVWATPQDFRSAYVYTDSFDVQYELPWDLTATVGYQGSAGHKLIRILNQNFIYPNNPRFNPVFFIEPDINSNYNALLARLTRRFSKGLQLEASYRWSKSIDTLSYEGPGAVTNQTNPIDLASERGPSDFDVTHYFVASALWDIPFFTSRKDFAGKVLGGWQINTILTAHSGFPWTPKTNTAALQTPGGQVLSPIRPLAYFGGALDDSSNDAFIRPGGNFPGGGQKYFLIAASGPPGIGRNSFRGPKYFDVDFSLVKEFALTERARIEFRANLFNAFNKLNLQQIGFFNDGAIVESPNFGRSPGGLAGRVIEFQGRISF
jgi:hypothetical protein